DRDRRGPSPPLPLGRDRPVDGRLPRPGVGRALPGRRGAVRAVDAGVFPGRAVVADDPPQAGGVPAGLRRVGRRAGRRLPGGRRGAVDGRPRHRPQPGQDRRRDDERAGVSGGAGGVGVVLRVRLVVHGRGAAGPIAAGHRCRCPGDDRRLGCLEPRSEAARVRLRRFDHRLRVHAKRRDGGRSPGKLFSRELASRRL
ncbi:MAG: DNA-3-methyladenine glycosylase, partial [uncultured Thermomicrobiales bacterium]